jgi:hypothetical protein
MLMLGPRARTEASAPVLRFLRETVQLDKPGAVQHKPRRQPEAPRVIAEATPQPANL